MKKMMKKLALILALALFAAGVLGCGSADSGSTASSAGSSTAITSEAVAESEAGAGESEAYESEAYDSEAYDSETADAAEEASSETADAAAQADNSGTGTAAETADAASDLPVLDPDGSYDSKEDVALYLYEYGELPSNYITKKQAQNMGWSGGSVEQYAPGKCIGGSYFGNNEGILPDGSYHECDIDTLGAKSRGAKRIVYSDDGCIYYTEDHYETFTLLYTADGPSDGNTVYGD